MNRRRFIQSLAAVFSLPAASGMSLRAATGVLPTATAAATVPAHARSWAVYMSTLHGECTPQILQNLLNIPAVDAKKYMTQLIADGAIKSHPLLQNSVSELAKPNERSLLEKVKNRLKMKSETESEEVEVYETSDVTDGAELEVDALEELPVVDLEVIAEDGPEEVEFQALEEDAQFGNERSISFRSKV